MDKIHYKELIEKYLEGNIADTEIKELPGQIKNNRQLQNWWEQEFTKSGTVTDPILRDKLFTRIKEETLKHTLSRTKGVRTLPMIPWRWMAAILSPVCIALSTYYSIDLSQTTSVPFIVKADKGDGATTELPDGTNVVFNPASQLSYLNNFGEKVRGVQLSGEIYFKVVPDEKHTFIVRVGDLEVKVSGTSFNVSAYKDAKDIMAVSLEGKAGIYTQGTSRMMKPGDKTEYNKITHQLVATQVHPNDYTEWTKGNIYFKKESLESITKTLSWTYDVEIRFDSNKLLKEYFMGTISSGGIQNALNILMLTPLSYYEIDGSVIVLKEEQISIFIMKLDIAILKFSPGMALQFMKNHQLTRVKDRQPIGRKGRAVGIPVKQPKSFDIWKIEHPL